MTFMWHPSTDSYSILVIICIRVAGPSLAEPPVGEAEVGGLSDPRGSRMNIHKNARPTPLGRAWIVHLGKSLGGAHLRVDESSPRARQTAETPKSGVASGGDHHLGIGGRCSANVAPHACEQFRQQYRNQGVILIEEYSGRDLSHTCLSADRAMLWRL